MSIFATILPVILLGFQIIVNVDAQAITGFTLIKTPSTVIGSLSNTINLATVGTSLNIKAETSNASINRVTFWFDTKEVGVEKVAPYAVGGDTNGVFASFKPMTTVGSHNITAVAYDASGKSIGKNTAIFSVVASSQAPAVQIPVAVPAPISTPVVTTKAPAKSPIVSPNVIIKGELRKWHKITLAFTGPYVTEQDAINPFTNYRFSLNFTHSGSGKQYMVPGYFAADGDAANSGAAGGDQWHCIFSPDEIGVWTYKASFVIGNNVATTTTGGTGTSFNGIVGSFTIAKSNKTGRDHRGKGRLQYVGEHHLQFAETGEWFLKAGADSPENFLAYDDFDNTPDVGGRRKSWEPHKRHFVTGSDPSWQNGKGAGIIGAINYLSNEGMNAFSFLTMNIDGDDKNVYPYISTSDLQRMDVSKLAQWEIVFEHADKMGMFLHFKLAETENDQLLDGGNLGNERKLYYRELIARFGHHLALNWNLAEEISNTIPQIKQFSDYFKATDPYKSIVITHTRPGSTLYDQLTGYPTFDGPSLQTSPSNVFPNTLNWVKDSSIAGHKWIVTNDEQNPANAGVVPDSVDPNHNQIRQLVLWGNIMAGGAGVEYYFGYSYAENDLLCEDFTSRQNMWTQSRYALEFFQVNNVPFWRMSNDENRVNSSTDWLLSSSDGKIHVVYRRSITSNTSINMSGLSGSYSVKWYNPRTGGTLENGSILSIVGGNNASYGKPPNTSDNMDWVILIKQV